MAGGGGEINGVPNLNAQLPWLVSGGLLGLAFVVFGSAILVAHNARVDRARLEAKLDEMTAALDRANATDEPVVIYKPQPRPQHAVASVAAAEPAPATPARATNAPVKRAPAKRAPAKKTTTRKSTASATGSPRR
jgi:hypothetical protein